MLSRRELNRALLARQHLLERAQAPLPEVLERVAGIQAQYAPSTYVGLWTRVAGFERRQLDAALEAREVVQGTLMRGTIHLVSRDDFWPFALATAGIARRGWLRLRQTSDEEMAEAAETVQQAMRAGPLTKREIEALVGKERAGGVHLWLDLVRVPPSGTWARRRADTYAHAEEWLGPPQTSVRDGIELLVRRYLRAFGPATAADVAAFTGLAPSLLAPALDGLSRVDADLLDLPGAPLPDAETPAPVRFIPTFDPILLAHCRRAGIVPAEHRPRIFPPKTPHPWPVFLVDGAVAGRWRFEAGRIELEPFGRLDAATRRELADEAERLREFHA